MRTRCVRDWPMPIPQLTNSGGPRVTSSEVSDWPAARSETCSRTRRRTWQSRRVTRRWLVSNDWRGPAAVPGPHWHRSPTDLALWTLLTADHETWSLSALPGPAGMDRWHRDLTPTHRIHLSMIGQYLVIRLPGSTALLDNEALCWLTERKQVVTWQTE